jgi:hypothetical protein
MSVFGPKYPYPMQHAVTHGERLCRLLARAESRDDACGDRAEAWLRGRSQEVELLFEVTLFDWASGRMSMAHACATLESYLGEVHAGAREHLGMGAAVELECCEDDVFLTAPSDHEVSDHEVQTGRAAKASGAGPSSPSDTWFDPGTVLQELLGARPDRMDEGGDSNQGGGR